jgi:hypothetical protein
MNGSEIEIRVESNAEDEEALALGLYVENVRVAQAHASGDNVRSLIELWGMKRESVQELLSSSLKELHSNSLEKVQLLELRDDGRRWSARYVFRDFSDVTAGEVWYELATGETGPKNASPFVRNMLRFAVHAELRRLRQAEAG